MAVVLLGCGVLLLTSWWTARRMATIRLVWGAGILLAAMAWFEVEVQLVNRGAIRLDVEDDLPRIALALLAPPLALGALTMMLIVAVSAWLTPLGRWTILTEIQGAERSLKQVEEAHSLHKVVDLPAESQPQDVLRPQPAGPVPTATAATWLTAGAGFAAVVGAAYLVRRQGRSSEP